MPGFNVLSSNGPEFIRGYQGFQTNACHLNKNLFVSGNAMHCYLETKYFKEVMVFKPMPITSVRGNLEHFHNLAVKYFIEVVVS